MVLVGPRAAGKTTVGEAVASGLGWEFIDADQRLAQLVGQSVGEHLRRVGEPAFRKAEERVCVPLLEQARDQVIALGGGAVLSVVVRARLLHPELFVAFLFATADVLAARIAASPELRPPLTALPPRREVELLLARRLPRYRQVADATFDTVVQAPAHVASAICSSLPPD